MSVGALSLPTRFTFPRARHSFVAVHESACDPNRISEVQAVC